MAHPRTLYREASGRGATGVGLVILLYEQVIHDVRRAVQAIERNNIEERTREINHALWVISYLQGTLDLSVKAPVTQNLARFYQMLRQGLIQAQATGSREILQQQIACLLEVREAWEALDRQANFAGKTSTQKVHAQKTAEAEPFIPSREPVSWKG